MRAVVVTQVGIRLVTGKRDWRVTIDYPAVYLAGELILARMSGILQAWSLLTRNGL